MDENVYYVYILTNTYHRVLYIGVTNNIARRLAEHRNGEANGFTKRYKLWKLVYLESTQDIRSAIAREKQLKGWLRLKKEQLIVSLNPQWEDLGVRYELA